MRVIGAGLGRTGTLSLKIALEQLLGGPCYHMAEVFGHPDHVPIWAAAYRGDPPDWNGFLEEYVACVDWPAAGFWRELSEANQDAIILLSHRDPQSWWESASATIFPSTKQAPEGVWKSMVESMFGNSLTRDLADRDACIEAYERHNADVRATAPRDRLVEWQPGDGWGPICAALGLPVPEREFPHVNTKEDWASRGVGVVIQEAQQHRAGS